ncbi:ribosomal protein S18-alanine N-acetyltransferase [Microcoleus sp. POL8_C6]|uniref:ribosomal protein S18-alanine N-acetyltransferase n=2 Tax=unclassified Microcoleus TaxID=2642155 RepID=UPI002FCF5774
MFSSVQFTAVRFLQIKHLAAEDLNSAVELDRLCFGGLWTLEGYGRELGSPNSDLLGLWASETDVCKSERFDSELKSIEPNTILNSKPISVERCSPATPNSKLTPTLIGLGCLWAILEEAHITILAIHPSFQGQGLGQALLWDLLKKAHYRQLERATLEVRESNLAAFSLYQKFGFKEAGRRKRYYEDTGEDALVMWRSGIEKTEFLQYLAVEKVQICDRLRQKNWHLAIDIFEF